MMKMTCKFLFAVSLTLAPGLASAGDICPPTAKSDWMSADAIAEKAGALGYVVRKVEEEHGCWEVKGTDAAGARVEVYFHPVTAEVVKVKS